MVKMSKEKIDFQIKIKRKALQLFVASVARKTQTQKRAFVFFSFFSATIFLISLVFPVLPVVAFVMSSQNYRIQADSLNVGGVGQGSTNYRSEDTIGELGTDESQSANYRVRAGYQQMLETYLAISSPADVTMPTLSGIGPGTATSDATWTVTTDNVAGYRLSLKATTAPALQSGANSFADYTPAESGTPDFTFTIAATSSEFGFSPEGTNLVQKFKDNGSVCNTGSNDTADRCWYNFATSDETVVNSSSSNHPSGTATTVKFQAQIGSSAAQTAGTYTATIIATATTN